MPFEVWLDGEESADQLAQTEVKTDPAQVVAEGEPGQQMARFPARAEIAAATSPSPDRKNQLSRP